jgi:hypothetical protein
VTFDAVTKATCRSTRALGLMWPKRSLGLTASSGVPLELTGNCDGQSDRRRHDGRATHAFRALLASPPPGLSERVPSETGPIYRPCGKARWRHGGRMTANRTAERLALLGIALAAVSPATARSVEYRWTSGPDMGGQITAAIQNAAGSAFRRSSRCSSEYRRGAERLCAERARSPGPLRPAYSFGRPSPCVNMLVNSLCICSAP